MLAKRFIGLLPDLTEQEMIDVNIISSITKAAMIEGGKNAKPGEITMAHNGVFIVLDSLRQPLEDRKVTVAWGMQVDRATKLQSVAQITKSKYQDHCLIE
nr:unnamed protein product [Callosobruchus chinensis]